MITIEPAILLAGLLMAIAILATRFSVRLGVPALILFLGTGMLAGSDGIGGIWFDDPELTWSVGLVALSILLFASGLDTDTRQLRPVLGPGLLLATVGVVVTSLTTMGFYALAFERPLVEGLLLGAIVASTDAAAVFGVLRSAGIRLRGRIQPLLELESGSNDPMAIFLTLFATTLVAGEAFSIGSITGGLLLQMGLGLAAGLLGGRAIGWAVNHLKAPQEALYSVFTSALALALFSGTALIGGSGYVAIYVAGLVLSTRPLLHRRAVVRFHDSLSWLAQVSMFVLLGLLAFPSRFRDLAGEGLAVAAFILFVARPLAVLISLTPFRFPLREQAMVSWVGLRGAVPIILATWPRLAGVEGAERIFDLVFFVVVASVLLQGITLAPVARWLGVIEAPSESAEPPPEVEESVGAALLTLRVGPRAQDQPLVELGLPHGALIALIERPEGAVVPQGSTRLHAGDVVRVMVQTGQEATVRQVLDAGEEPEGAHPS